MSVDVVVGGVVVGDAAVVVSVGEVGFDVDVPVAVEVAGGGVDGLDGAGLDGEVVGPTARLMAVAVGDAVGVGDRVVALTPWPT